MMGRRKLWWLLYAAMLTLAIFGDFRLGLHTNHSTLTPDQALNDGIWHGIGLAHWFDMTVEWFRDLRKVLKAVNRANDGMVEDPFRDRRKV